MNISCDTEHELRALSKAAGTLRPKQRDEVRLECCKWLTLLEVSGCKSISELMALAKRAAQAEELSAENARLREEISKK